MCYIMKTFGQSLSMYWALNFQLCVYVTQIGSLGIDDGNVNDGLNYIDSYLGRVVKKAQYSFQIFCTSELF